MAVPFLPLALGVGVLLVAAGAAAAEKKPAPPPGPPGVPPPGPPGVPPPFPPTVPPPFPPAVPPGVPPVTPAVPCDLDPHMPAAHVQATQALLANPAVPSQTLVAAALIAESGGYPMAGGCLRAEARRRGGPQEPPPGFDPLNPLTWPAALGYPVVPPAVPPGVPPTGPPVGPPGVPPVVPPAGPPPLIPGLPGWLQVPPVVGPPPGFPPPGLEGAMPFTIRTGDRPYGLAAYWTGLGGKFRELEAINPGLGPLQNIEGQPPYPAWVPGFAILIPAGWNPYAKPMPPVGL